MGRSPCCDKSKVKRGTWSPEEDAALKNYLHIHGTAGNWIALPQKAGLRRCGKSCRLRWLNYLRPDIKHGGFTHEEENIICSLYNRIGSRWSIIASQLPGRTDNDVKNYWNTKLKKKLIMKLQNHPHTNTNIETVAAPTTATTGIASGTNIFQESTNSPTFPDNATGLANENSSSVSSEPVNYYNFPRFILEGSNHHANNNNNNNNNSCSFLPCKQDLSSFELNGFRMDENYGANAISSSSIDEYSCEVMSSIWSQEGGFGDESSRSNADLFSIFQS
ncbi:hypothetical protein OROGR_005937 [Orobanche gracilis]